MLYIFSLGILNVRPFLHAQNLNFANEGTENHDLYIYIYTVFCMYIYSFLQIHVYIYIYYIYTYVYFKKNV